MRLIKAIKCKIFGHPLFAYLASCPFTGKTYSYCVECGARKEEHNEE